jgi:hypothetical protein
MGKKKLISIKEAAALGIDRLRLPKWADKMDHIKIDIVDGDKVGPWIHLWCPFNTECNGRDPVNNLSIMPPWRDCLDFPEWEVYRGPLPDSEEYKARVASFAGCLKETTT